MSIIPYVYMAAFVQGILLFLGFLTRKTTNRLSNVALALIILVISLELLFSWGGVTGYNNSRGAFPFWKLNSYLAIPPSMFLFFEGHLSPAKRHPRFWLALYIPALFQIAVEFVFWAVFPQTYFHLFTNRTIAFLWFQYNETLPLAASAVVLTLVGIRLYKISATAGLAHRKQYWRLFGVYAVLVTLVILWIPPGLFDARLYKPLEVSLLLFLFIAGYLAYFNPDYFEIRTAWNTLSQFPGYDDKKELLRLKDLFDRQSVYRQAKLTVADVATQLNLPAKYISYLLGTRLGTNFTDFVNGYRVKEIIRRMPVEKNKNLLGIALDAGFNSKSSFNLVFKKATGKTPSTYFKGKN